MGAVFLCMPAGPDLDLTIAGAVPVADDEMVTELVPTPTLVVAVE